MLPFTRRFLRDSLPGKGRLYFWGILFLVLTTIATVAVPLFVGDSVEILREAGRGDGLTPEIRRRLLTQAGAIILLGVLLGLFRVLSRVIIFLPGRQVEAEVRQRFFTAVLALPANKLSSFKLGDLISRGTSDISSVRVMLSMGVLNTANSLMLLSMSLYLMFRLSPLLTILCLAPTPILMKFVGAMARDLMVRSRQVQEQLGQLSEHVRQVLRAHTLVATYPVFDSLFRRFDDANKDYSRSAEKMLRLRLPLMSITGSITQTSQFILLLVGGLIILAGRTAFTLGDFVAFSFYLTIIQDPMRIGGWLIPMFQRGEICLKRIYELADLAAAHADEEGRKPVQDAAALDEGAPADAPLIAIRDLNFKYPDDGATASDRAADDGTAFSLSIPSLEIHAGRKYGVFGPTGAGKTTLINILTNNLLAPPETCFLRGADYTDIRADAVRRLFAVVPQSSRHFAKTVRENIEMVQKSALEAGGDNGRTWSFDDAYRISQLAGDVAQFPAELETLLGEHGINLSGGQKQRLALMRALVKPHRVLVLDDIVSAVDHHTETQILQHLFSHLGDHTLVFVSHRISALIGCDEILVVENGRIVDRGRHEELLQRHDVYRRTYEHQVLEQRLEEISHAV